MRIITNFGTLMKLASELGKAKQSGDIDRINEAQRKHDEYRDLCLQSDQMVIGSKYLNEY